MSLGVNRYKRKIIASEGKSISRYFSYFSFSLYITRMTLIWRSIVYYTVLLTHRIQLGQMLQTVSTDRVSTKYAVSSVLSRRLKKYNLVKALLYVQTFSVCNFCKFCNRFSREYLVQRPMNRSAGRDGMLHRKNQPAVNDMIKESREVELSRTCVTRMLVWNVQKVLSLHIII